MIFRLYHKTLGGHVHCRLFAGRGEGALGKCGDLCMRVEEFRAFRESFRERNDGDMMMQFREEVSNTPAATG